MSLKIQGCDRHRRQQRDRSGDRARTCTTWCKCRHRLRGASGGDECLEQQIAALGSRSIGVAADVRKLADLQKLIDAAVSRFGHVDIMVNNAGIETRTSVLDTTEAQYEAVMSVNLKSAFFATQIAARQMIKQGGGGRIINITSVHEDWPMPGNTAYCLAKGGMRMLTRTAGLELAKHNILVVGVGPRGGHADQLEHDERSGQLLR